MSTVFGVIVGTELLSKTSMELFAKEGIRRTCLRPERCDAILRSLLSLQGSPRISIPMGTPIGASSVGGEKPAGTVTTGDPVRAARIPFRPD